MTDAAGFLGLTDDAPDDLKPPTPTQSSDAELLADLKGVFRRDWDNHPRSQQRTLGPSEVGHACARRLAGGLLQLDVIQPDGDPLPAWLGTAGHAKFEDAVKRDNEHIVEQWTAGNPSLCTQDQINGKMFGRWLSERRVTIRDGLAGTCDLYDTWTDTVIDLKFPGSSRATHYRNHGPSPEYRTQANLYGRGYRNEGYDVKRVAIWFLPRAGFLSRSFIWSEPYSDAVVDAALARLDDIAVVINDLRIEDNPALIALVPKTPGECAYCPFFVPRIDAQSPAHACTGAAK